LRFANSTNANHIRIFKQIYSYSQNKLPQQLANVVVNKINLRLRLYHLTIPQYLKRILK